MIECSYTQEILLLKEVNKLDLYNDCKISDQQRNLNLITNLQSHFLIKPFYCFQDIANLYLVTEFVQGGNLSQILNYHIFTEEEAKIIICGSLLALNKLHLSKIIFLGLTPNRILIDEKGYPKLHQLNDAKYFSEFELGPNEQAISIYLAPEVLLRQQFGPEADFYSLGIILYEIMTGRKPIEQDSTREELIDTILQKQIQVKKSELPEGWSLDAADFINKLIQKSPTTRLGFYGISELQKHNWLSGTSWQKLEEKILPNTFIPKNTKIQRKSNLLQWDVKRTKKSQIHNPFLSNQEFQNQFKGFTFNSESIEGIDLDTSIKEPMNKYLQT